MLALPPTTFAHRFALWFQTAAVTSQKAQVAYNQVRTVRGRSSKKRRWYRAAAVRNMRRARQLRLIISAYDAPTFTPRVPDAITAMIPHDTEVRDGVPGLTFPIEHKATAELMAESWAEEALSDITEPSEGTGGAPGDRSSPLSGDDGDSPPQRDAPPHSDPYYARFLLWVVCTFAEPYITTFLAFGPTGISFWLHSIHPGVG